ncbi:MULTISPECIES: DUF418 domain-containing protein [Heyndrickxia]|nr:DUF418 domain-containing protein [Heyndrickxia shackletonii]MBB2479739.1 DUF418 domain-containing protein [Bacillus sp. APMAM]NEZ01484.1 DUF418 domain-containing protein [Heyndrickxia shackletonii]RTZ56001.1 DUF418 domain-containing protein [Bacillus sp. SAJ1]
MKLQMEPLHKEKRISTLDVLRGISLLGIVIVNIISFNAPVLYYNPYEWWKDGDAAVYKWVEIIFQSSFYPIFAMMFGYGSGILRDRIKEKGLTFSKIYIKRLLFLLLIGLLHAFLIWSGDILANYAIYGMLLMVLLELSGEVLMISGIMLFLIPNLLFILYILVNALIDPNTTLMYADIANVNKAFNAYTTGSYWEITKQRVEDWTAVNGSSNLFFSVFSILPLMMIGAGASKMKWLQNAKTHKRKWLFLFIVSFIVGIFLKSLPVIIDSNLAFKLVQQSIGGTIFSFAIVAFIVLLMTNRICEKILRPIAAAGRMSLTIYLVQSIVGSLIFYHYGLGLYGGLTLLSCVMIGIFIYIIQVILAEIWFIKFQYGPLEKVWRMVTYGKK